MDVRAVSSAVGRRRQLAGLLLAALLLPTLTVVLVTLRASLGLDDVLLLYLVAVLLVTAVGGVWPSTVASVAAVLVVNWYFTPPLHTWSIDKAQNLLALLLFVAVALGVSALVHLVERRRSEAERVNAEAAVLEQANALRTALLAAVGHDLRTPLASVKAGVSSLRQTDVTLSAADRDELLTTIEEGADRLSALIADLLDMSRIQTGALTPRLRPTAVEEVAPLALRGLDARRLQLRIADDLPLVATDPVLVERALANVVANALRHSPSDRPPALVASTTGGAVVLEVVDHGPGVPAEMRERMFAPFQQLGDGETRTSDGVGLGLAVARGFVEAVGGRIRALDTPGGGLTMRLELPVAGPA